MHLRLQSSTSSSSEPDDKPIAWLVGSIDDLARYGKNVSAQALELARAHWPGALTLIVGASDEVPPAYKAPPARSHCACPTTQSHTRSSSRLAACYHIGEHLGGARTNGHRRAFTCAHRMCGYGCGQGLGWSCLCSGGLHANARAHRSPRSDRPRSGG